MKILLKNIRISLDEETAPELISEEQAEKHVLMNSPQVEKYLCEQALSTEDLPLLKVIKYLQRMPFDTTQVEEYLRGFVDMSLMPPVENDVSRQQVLDDLAVLCSPRDVDDADQLHFVEMMNALSFVLECVRMLDVHDPVFAELEKVYKKTRRASQSSSPEGSAEFFKTWMTHFAEGCRVELKIDQEIGQTYSEVQSILGYGEMKIEVEVVNELKKKLFLMTRVIPAVAVLILMLLLSGVGHYIQQNAQEKIRLESLNLEQKRVQSSLQVLLDLLKPHDLRMCEVKGGAVLSHAVGVLDISPQPLELYPGKAVSGQSQDVQDEVLFEPFLKEIGVGRAYVHYINDMGTISALIHEQMWSVLYTEKMLKEQLGALYLLRESEKNLFHMTQFEGQYGSPMSTLTLDMRGETKKWYGFDGTKIIPVDFPELLPEDYPSFGRNDTFGTEQHYAYLQFWKFASSSSEITKKYHSFPHYSNFKDSPLSFISEDVKTIQTPEGKRIVLSPTQIKALSVCLDSPTFLQRRHSINAYKRAELQNILNYASGDEKSLLPTSQFLKTLDFLTPLIRFDASVLDHFVIVDESMNPDKERQHEFSPLIVRRDDDVASFINAHVEKAFKSKSVSRLLSFQFEAPYRVPDKPFLVAEISDFSESHSYVLEAKHNKVDLFQQQDTQGYRLKYPHVKIFVYEHDAQKIYEIQSQMFDGRILCLEKGGFNFEMYSEKHGVLELLFKTKAVATHDGIGELQLSDASGKIESNYSLHSFFSSITKNKATPELMDALFLKALLSVFAERILPYGGHSRAFTINETVKNEIIAGNLTRRVYVNDGKMIKAVSRVNADKMLVVSPEYVFLEYSSPVMGAHQLSFVECFSHGKKKGIVEAVQTLGVWSFNYYSCDESNQIELLGSVSLKESIVPGSDMLQVSMVNDTAAKTDIGLIENDRLSDRKDLSVLYEAVLPRIFLWFETRSQSKNNKSLLKFK